MEGNWLRRLIVWPLALAALLDVSRACAAESTAALARSLLDDAELHDLTFLDAEHGWAVGDRGVIWRTENGGQSWQLVPSGVDCPLHSVHFNDLDNGWVAGGKQRPYLDADQGVLLRTFDGGQTWEADKGLLLSTIRVVKFFGAQGWALAAPSHLFPSGAFFTADEGRTWTPLADREIANWTLAAFADPLSAAFAGSRGARAAVNDRRIDPWQQTEFGLREPRAICLSTRKDGWLAGDGGLLLKSDDGGRSWQPTQEPPGAEHFDFRAVAVQGSQVWIAGNPGSRVMHSADGGSTWEVQQTGQPLPINCLNFVDTQRGWAAGALGTILVTIDGGRTWQKQHGVRERAALLGVYSDAERLPLEAIARLAANEGFITAVEIVARRDAEPDTPAVEVQAARERAALLALGCSALERPWGFPLRQAGIPRTVEHLTDGWNRMYAGRGVEQLESHLVRQIRVWRPEVIITSAASPAGDDPLGHLMNQLVLRAVADAGNVEKFPELADVGLHPWNVKKVAGGVPSGKMGTINVNTSQLAPRLTRSLADYAASARGLLADRYDAPPNAWGFRLHVDNLGQGLGQQDFFSGLNLAPGGDARRELPSLGRAGMDAMRQIAERHRNLQAILAHTERSDRGPAVLLGQIGDLTRGLDPATAGQTLFELAQTYRNDGHWDYAAATFQLLSEKYPNHPLTTPAFVWLVQYWSSGEALLRALPASESRPRALVRGANTAAQIPDAIPPASQGPLSSIRTANFNDPQPTAHSATQRAARALEFGKALARVDAHASSDFHVQFPLAAARAQAADAGTSADRFFATIANSRPHDAWWACARGEQWLFEGANGAPPKPVATAQKVAAKPRLDGDLTDAIWQQAARLDLASPLSDDAEWPGTMMLAYDDEFLYVAIDCRCAPLAKYSDDNRTRQRDADLTANDRVELRLDVDRDWTTFYKLSVDYRGWTAEECWGDATWNPRWFVAAARSNENWTVEAAIPLAQLSAHAVEPKTIWALGLQRIVPGVGFQSWTRPATVAGTPQGGGYLIFE
ncbi:MAG: YCF48-related protein [Singulisphaera sp.]